MDVEVLNDARTDLAERMAQLRIADLNYADGSNTEAWILELKELEKRHGYSSVEATVEWYIDHAPNIEQVDGLGFAIEFYLDSLWEWLNFGNSKRLSSVPAE